MASAFFLTPRLTGLRSVFSLQTHPRFAPPTVEAGVAAGMEPREVLSDGGRHPALSFIAPPPFLLRCVLLHVFHPFYL